MFQVLSLGRTHMGLSFRKDREKSHMQRAQFPRSVLLETAGPSAGMSDLLASLGSTGRIVWSHMLNTLLTHNHTEKNLMMF